MRIGEMRERIKVFRHTSCEGSHTINLDPELEMIVECWAKREDILTERLWAAEAYNAVNKKQFIIWRRTDIKVGMYIEVDDERLDILGVAGLDSKKKWTIILAGVKDINGGKF